MTLQTRILASLLVSGHFMAGLLLGWPALVLPPFVYIAIKLGGWWFADIVSRDFDYAIDRGIDSGMLLAAQAIRDDYREAARVIDGLREKIRVVAG